MIYLRIEVLFLLTIVGFHYSDSETCTCDPATANTSPGGCNFTYDNNGNPVNITGCTCKNTDFKFVINTTTEVVKCANVTTTTTIATTTNKPTTTSACTDSDNDGICDYEEYALSLRCYNMTMSEDAQNYVWYGLIFSTAWIIFWCFVTLVVNIMHKNNGHQRWIHLYEEIGIILLMVSIGILNFAFEEQSKQTACKIVGIASHFFMALVAAAFFFEATFAKSMVHGRPKKNGCLPPFLNYLFPIILAGIPAGVTYYFQQKNYGATLLHCFAVLTQDMMWGFIIPVWILICAATFQAQMACLACDMTNKDQDKAQCFWAKRSAKTIVLVAFWLLSIWLLIMHAGDEQLLYLFVLSIILCVIFGPLLFICHTYCHLNTCMKWGKPSGCFGSIYALCPEKEKEVIYNEKIVYVDRPVNEKTPLPLPNQMPTEKISPYHPDPKREDAMPRGNDGTHTQAQQFYSWLFDKNKKNNDPNDILFKPKPY